jgi:hypothetical protein
LAGGLIAAFSSHLGGYFVGYEKADENDGHTVYASSAMFLSHEYEAFRMTNEEAQDVIDHSEKYTAYWVEIYLKNNSLHMFYYLRADSKQPYENMWFDSSSLYEGTLNLKPLEEFKDSRVLVIVKTENMSEEDIDQRIRSLEISIYAQTSEAANEHIETTLRFRN